jgi:hypothetical protein
MLRQRVVFGEGGIDRARLGALPRASDVAGERGTGNTIVGQWHGGIVRLRDAMSRRRSVQRERRTTGLM